MSIARIPKPSAREFKRKYSRPEQPVIIENAIESWPARNLWSPSYFKKNFGDIKVKVESLKADKASDPSYFVEQVKVEEMTIGEYLERTESNPDPGSKLYLAELPITDIIPITKKQIRSLGYYSETLRRLAGIKTLFWMGAAGCTTALHYDPIPNFVLQIWGRKKWVIFPKEQQDMLYVPSDLEISDFSPINYEKPDYEKYPKYKEATPIEFVLEAGEILYLPEGWVHYVRALDFSISLNFCWFPWNQAPKFLGEALRTMLTRRD